MRTYKLMITKGGDIELANSSPLYPSLFEQKINNFAGETITTVGTEISFIPGFRNSFAIRKDKWDIFVKKCIPNIGVKEEYNNNVVWDKDEETFEI